MRQFGLLGKSLKHSFSKSYFTQKFAQEGLTDHQYENFELESIAQLPQLIAQLPFLQGFNITIPYKEEVLSFLHGKNKVVQSIGACNCVKIVEGKLYGFNTDVIGFRQSLLKFLQPHHTHALILGTGGAAKAVQYVLEELGISWQAVSRKKSAQTLSYSAITANVLNQHLLIINTSPVGMYPHIADAPQIPYELLTPRHFLFDLIYNPEKTLFLQKGEEQGAAVSNGYEMLLLQAEESWRIWNDDSAHML